VIYNDDNDDLVIFAVNRDLEGPMHLECKLRGFSDYQVVEHIVYESKDKKAGNTQEKPLNVIPHNHGNAVARENLVLAELPQLSWNVIRLQRKESK
jgi:alpha-N-arabinofuranosidase